MHRPFLPMTLDERGQDELDVILVSGDAYVDHSTYGVALVGRWLESHGFSVGVIAQPRWTDVEAFRVLGRPRLFFGVTAGQMDSMVNHYTASRRIRSDDAYSPGGVAGARPDRATIAYANRCKQAYPGVPVILGGVEASLRRFAHYDYWQDKVRRSILLDAKGDLLGPRHGRAPRRGDRAAPAGRQVDRRVPGHRGDGLALGRTSALPTAAHVEAPSFEACAADPAAFNRLTVIAYREANPSCGLSILQRSGDRATC